MVIFITLKLCKWIHEKLLAFNNGHEAKLDALVSFIAAQIIRN